MIKAKDIQNVEDLRKWLEGLPMETEAERERARQIAVQIAFRAAARVLPVAWDYFDNSPKTDLTALPVLRCNLITGVAVKSFSPEIRRAARTAATYTAATYAGAGGAVDPSIYAASAIYTAAAYAAVDSATKAAYAVTDAVVTAAYIVTDAAIYARDCELLESGGDLSGVKLWHDQGNPLSSAWSDLRTRLQDPARSDEWSFWIDWYEGLLAGQQMPVEMLTEIALIEDEHWQAGSQVVNPMIAEIRRNHAREATPNAEEIVQNPATGLLDVVATSSLADNRLRDVQAKMRDAADIFDGQGGLNGPYGDLMAEVALIRRKAESNNPRPIGLYDACRRASRRVEGKAAQGHCPQNDALVEDFIGQLTEAAFDITGFNDDVRAVVANRALLKLEERSQANPELAAEHLLPAAQEVVTITEGDLQEEYQQDAKTAADPDAGDKARAAALYRLASRTFRIVKWAKDATGRGLIALALVPGAVEGITLVVNAPAFQAALKYLLSFF